MDTLTPASLFVNPSPDLPSAPVDLPWPSDADLDAMAEDSAALDVVCSGLCWL